ncbi:transposase [Aneurinibacillus tyrosinisolvens]|uniref:transposase n=1 Tax=Aneurinibacillus tyrosinisolvens TaxID=1443435 RepID=UPI000A6ED17B|nr:transposase [Aneurinibacillus tyrosinisolvens]
MDTLVADGAYYRASTAIHAEKVNVAFHVSKMTGSSVPDDRMGVDTFEMNEETHQIVRCPAGHAPLYSEYKPEKEVYRAKFAKPDCENCPLLHRCPVEEKKEMNTLRFTETKRQADRMRTKMGSERHKALANFRAGVEGVPSVLRRVYRIDELPIRGFVRSKIWIHFKVMAYNIKRVNQYARRAS